MVFHMKTTLNIDDTVMAELKQEAARTGRTMGALVEAALRLFLRRSREAAELPPLPSFRGGKALVDIADRDAMYRILNEEKDHRLYPHLFEKPDDVKRPDGDET